MSEGEKQAILLECENLQNLVRASVQNLNKIIAVDNSSVVANSNITGEKELLES